MNDLIRYANKVNSTALIQALASEYNWLVFDEAIKNMPVKDYELALFRINQVIKKANKD